MKVERLDAQNILFETEALAEVLHACVDAGASVWFVLPFTLDEARRFWADAVAPSAARDERIVLVAREGESIVGTVQLLLAMPANQPHRAEVSKMLVHPEARRKGVAKALLCELEKEARKRHRTLLVLDTVTGSPADALYRSLGYEFAGEIPDFAYAADGKTLVPTSLFYKRLSTSSE